VDGRLNKTRSIIHRGIIILNFPSVLGGGGLTCVIKLLSALGGKDMLLRMVMSHVTTALSICTLTYHSQLTSSGFSVDLMRCDNINTLIVPTAGLLGTF